MHDALGTTRWGRCIRGLLQPVYLRKQCLKVYTARIIINASAAFGEPSGMATSTGSEDAVRDVFVRNMGPDTTVLIVTDPQGGKMAVAFPGILAAKVIAVYQRAGYMVDVATSRGSQAAA